MNNRICILVFIVAIHSFSSLSQAENESDKPRSELKRWRISVNMGTVPASLGPAEEIEKQMIANKYYGTYQCWLLGKISYPRSGFFWTGAISVNYLLKPAFLIGALISKAAGTTKGYNPSFNFLTVDYDVDTYAIIFSFRHSVFQLGIGPAWHAAKAWRSDAGVLGPTNSVNKLGYVVDFGITVQKEEWIPVYFEFKVQYQRIGRVEIGPYENTRWTPSGYETAIFPKTGVSYNYLHIGGGVGLQF